MVQMSKRPQNADRHIPLRFFGLLRCRRHRIESDVREEDARGALRNAPPSKVPSRVFRRNKGMPVRPRHLRDAGTENTRQPAENRHHAQLDKDNRRIEVRRFFDADHQDGRNRHDNHHGDQVERSGHMRAAQRRSRPAATTSPASTAGGKAPAWFPSTPSVAAESRFPTAASGC